MTETATTQTPFPERMHKQAIESRTRRVKADLGDLAKDAAALLWRLENGMPPDVGAARQLTEQAVRVREHLTALEILRETREWDEAERAGEQS